MFGRKPEPKAPRVSDYYPAFFERLPSMTGKTVVVTGASRGLGYVTALALAKKGATLFLLNRRSQRADEALAEMREASTGPVAPRLVDCDLCDFASVREAAGTVIDSTPEGIDVLCCNAGIMLQPDEASKDGYDITISTNVLSHFLLIKELMPQLQKSADLREEARIVNMSSGSGFGPPGFDARFYTKSGGNLGGEGASYERYHQSKLANLLITAALDDKLRAKGSKIKAIACTPGVCGTDMFVHAQATFRPGAPADLAMVPTPEDGALAQLKCICDPEVESGDLFSPPRGNGFPIKEDMMPPKVLIDQESKDSLWAACELAVGSFDMS